MFLKIIFIVCLIVLVSGAGAFLIYISYDDEKFNEEEKDGKEHKY